MSLLGRMKRALSAHANAAIDKIADPAKQIDMIIHELDDANRAALQELVSYKATAKQLEREIERWQQKVHEWEQRAVLAVKQGDDELAKTALREKRAAAQQLAQVTSERDEALGYAIELNRSRKKVESRLRTLKLKKGTLATQIAAARAGGNVLGQSDEVWERMARAEERIDEEVVRAEVDASLASEDADRVAADAIDEATNKLEADAMLAALKHKMSSQGALPAAEPKPARQLPEKKPGE